MKRALRRGEGWEEVINAGIIITWLDPRADDIKGILFSDWLRERARYAYLAAHQEIFHRMMKRQINKKPKKQKQKQKDQKKKKKN